MPPPLKSFAGKEGIVSYEAVLMQVGTAAPTVVAESPTNEIKDMVWTRSGVGIYSGSSPSWGGTNGFENNKSTIQLTSGESTYKPIAGAVNWDIVIYSFNAAGALTDFGGQFHVSFKYWPK